MSSAKVYEENSAIYIAPEYLYSFSNLTQEGGKAYYLDCQKKKNNYLDKFEGVAWKLIIREINNDQELSSFIKEQYGSGCSLGEKELQNGVINVLIDGYYNKETGKINRECMLNFMYVLKYIPQKNIAVTWSGGQDASFVGKNSEVVYDNEMVDSFQALD